MKLVSVSPTVMVNPDKIYAIEKRRGFVDILFDNDHIYVIDATYEQVLEALGTANNAYVDAGGDVYGV